MSDIEAVIKAAKLQLIAMAELTAMAEQHTEQIKVLQSDVAHHVKRFKRLEAIMQRQGYRIDSMPLED